MFGRGLGELPNSVSGIGSSDATALAGLAQYPPVLVAATVPKTGLRQRGCKKDGGVGVRHEAYTNRIFTGKSRTDRYVA